MLASATGALNTRAASRTPISPFPSTLFYARRDLGSRLVLLADPEKSIRYMSTDTVDRGLLDLTPWFPLNVRWFHWFHERIAEHPSFLVWLFASAAGAGFPVADLGALASLKAVLKDCVLMSVTAIQPPPGGRRVRDPSGRPMRYSHTPTDGLPMCRCYMAAGSCPEVD